VQVMKRIIHTSNPFFTRSGRVYGHDLLLEAYFLTYIDDLWKAICMFPTLKTETR
jgi:hypothetical protein